MSFPRYPKYKPSGVEWLGDVPEGWGVAPFKRQIARNDGGVWGDDPDGIGDTIVLRSTEQTVDGRWQLDNPAPRKLTASEIDGALLIEGDPLLTKSSGSSLHIGKTTLVTAEVEAMRCCYSNFMQRLRTKKTFLPRLAWYVLNNELARKQLDVLSNTTTGLANLNATMVGQLVVIVPSLPEQTAIAEFLDRETGKIDELVAEQRRLMELLKEKRQAVISHAVTQGLNPHAPMKPSGIEWLGAVPVGWGVKKLGRAAFMQEGPGLRNWQFTTEGTRVICVTNITEAGIDFARLEKFISVKEYKESYQHFTVRKGDVLLSSSGNSWGKVAIYEGDEEVILNTSTIRLNQTTSAPLDRSYIALLLQSDTVREQLRLAMTGSCQPNFGPTHLNSVMVSVPLRTEQMEILAFVQSATDKLDTLTAEAQRAIDLLQERRTALISAAVTGQIDVRTKVVSVQGAV